MLGRIAPLTFDQLADLLRKPWRRQIDSVHIHHTYIPARRGWYGQETVENIRRYHVDINHWSDIAQHLTIGADGSLWSGRHLDRAPASAIGHNGDGKAGPLMIEIVGNFDEGADRFEGDQEAATYQTVAVICEAFDLPAAKVRFHNEFNAAKTCPGSSMSLAPFRHAIEAEMQKLALQPVLRQFVQARSARTLINTRSDALTDVAAEPNYNDDVTMPADERGWPSRRKFSDDDREVFRRHVINTSMGMLSRDGEIGSSPAQIDHLLEQVHAWMNKEVGNRRIVFFAHGGLVAETSALKNVVLKQYQWWLANNVYPIFLVWETGINEIFNRVETQGEAGRGVFDPLLEWALGPTIGRPAWDRMKLNARLCLAQASTSGYEGGLRTFIGKFAAWRSRLGAAAPELHAVGHSAGSILLAEFLPVLQDALTPKVPAVAARAAASRNPSASPKAAPFLASLAFLAPAVRADTFKQALLPLINAGAIAQFAMFTMKRDSELQDNVARIYRQSLLYFVRNACESDCGPILGLEESIREDTELVKLFRYEQAPSDLANLVLSPRLGGVRKREQASATAHGAFDEDVPTMNSVMRRILELADDQLLPRSLDGRTDSRSAPRDGRFADSRVLQFRAIGSRGSAAEERGTGRVLALCIGIDTYADSPLQGCVADSRLWAATLEARGVIVHRTLFNEQATKRAIVDAWRRVSEGARPEDTIVIQFAGHGTFVSDKNGDESDGNDEAWVAFDYGSGGLLIDDEIGALIDGATLRRAARCVLLTDCCHSGTGTRARSMLPVAAKNSRFLPLAQNSAAMRAFERTYQDWRLELGIGSRGIDTLGREIHFAGCQDYQSSYESNGHGAFTLAATRALKGLKTGATYADWARAIAHAFDGNAQQRPNFRAPPDGARSLVLASRGRPAEIDPDTGELSSTSHGSAGLSAMQTPISQATVTALSERIDELEDEVRALRLTFEARQD